MTSSSLKHGEGQDRVGTSLPRFDVCLSVILVVGIVLRLAWLGTHSLWLDEGFTLFICHSADPLEAMRNVSNPPLSHFVFRYWMALVAPTSEVGLRLPAAIASCLALLLFAQVARLTMRDRWWQCAAVALYATSPFLIWYAHEMRMYSMFELSSMLALYSVFLYRDGKAMASTLLIFFATLLGFGIHYFSILTSAGAALCVLLYHRRGHATLRQLAWYLIAVVAGFAVWIYWLVAYLPSQLVAPWGGVAHLSLQSLLETPFRLLMIQLRFQPELLVLATVGLIALALLLTLYASFRTRRDPGGPTFGASKDAMLWVLLLAPIVGALVASLIIQPRFMPRYLIACTAPLILLLVGGVQRVLPRSMAGALFGLVVGLFCASNILLHRHNLKDGYREACSQLMEAYEPGDLLGVCTMMPEGFSQAPVQWYLSRQGISEPGIHDIHDFKDFEVLMSRVPQGRRVHLVVRWMSYSSPLIRNILASGIVEEQGAIQENVQWIVLSAR